MGTTSCRCRIKDFPAGVVFESSVAKGVTDSHDCLSLQIPTVCRSFVYIELANVSWSSPV